jgi:four helix bundle protein
MGDFKDLDVWRQSRAVTNAVYDLTESFPAGERFGVIPQLRRAAVSVSTNLAEGNGRRSARDQAQFYRIALGSAREVECLLVIAEDRGFAPKDRLGRALAQTQRLQRLISGLLRYCTRREK